MLPGLYGRTGLLPTEECRHWKLSMQSGLAGKGERWVGGGQRRI